MEEKNIREALELKELELEEFQKASKEYEQELENEIQNLENLLKKQTLQISAVREENENLKRKLALNSVDDYVEKLQAEISSLQQRLSISNENIVQLENKNEQVYYFFV
jgi:predicted  nucleic acid-binding Zn-ribbon protein